MHKDGKVIGNGIIGAELMGDPMHGRRHNQRIGATPLEISKRVAFLIDEKQKLDKILASRKKRIKMNAQINKIDNEYKAAYRQVSVFFRDGKLSAEDIALLCRNGIIFALSKDKWLENAVNYYYFVIDAFHKPRTTSSGKSESDLGYWFAFNHSKHLARKLSHPDKSAIMENILDLLKRFGLQ